MAGGFGYCSNIFALCPCAYSCFMSAPSTFSEVFHVRFRVDSCSVGIWGQPMPSPCVVLCLTAAPVASPWQLGACCFDGLRPAVLLWQWESILELVFLDTIIYFAIFCESVFLWHSQHFFFASVLA